MDRAEHNGFDRRETCRGCGSRNLISFLDYGSVPLAGDFLLPEEVGFEESFPMDLVLCQDCTLVQIVNVIKRERLFTDYRYLSSVTRTLMKHFHDYATVLDRDVLGGKKGLIVEIGCNDGVLLSPLRELGIPALGIDAAENVVEIAKSKGLNVQYGFFDRSMAEWIQSKHGQAEVITASNVFAHIDNLDEILHGVRSLLSPTGTFIVEVHYLVDLLNMFQFDTVYHEHLCYYSLHALQHLFGRFELFVTAVEHLPMHGGAVRVFAQQQPKSVPVRGESLESCLNAERERGICSPVTYQEFGTAVIKYRDQLREFVLDRKHGGRTLSGYGAAGRATTLLNYCGLDADVLDFVVDESPSRIGRYIPGVHIPIVARERLSAERTDDCLLTAWNYAEEIVGKEQRYLLDGGCFIKPLPEIQVMRAGTPWRNGA